MLSLSDWANGRSVRGQADEAAELLGSAGASALQQAQEEAPSGPGGGRGGGGVHEQLEHAHGEFVSLRASN